MEVLRPPSDLSLSLATSQRLSRRNRRRRSRKIPPRTLNPLPLCRGPLSSMTLKSLCTQGGFSFLSSTVTTLAGHHTLATVLVHSRTEWSVAHKCRVLSVKKTGAFQSNYVFRFLQSRCWERALPSTWCFIAAGGSIFRACP